MGKGQIGFNFKMVILGLIEKMTFDQTCEGGKTAIQESRRAFPGRGNNEGRGPTVSVHLACSRKQGG